MATLTFLARLLSYADHTKTTYFHLKSMESFISLALLSNVATGQDIEGIPGQIPRVCVCTPYVRMCILSQ